MKERSKARRWVSVTLWILAFLVTVSLAVFQRATGPSHPKRGTVVATGGQEVKYRLPRSSEGRDTLRVSVALPSDVTEARLQWRRYPTDDPYSELKMLPTADGSLEAHIPHQPAAGKVEYRIFAGDASEPFSIPPDETVVARYRASVPAGILIPHILAMFTSMLVSTRALLEVLRPGAPRATGLVLTSMGLLIVGGLVLGPMVQKAAFDAYWTGWPFGHDLTDNKTLVAFLAWLPASIVALRRAPTRVAVILGWVVMMGVFLIPHSMRGSELDWSEVESGGGTVVAAEPRE